MNRSVLILCIAALGGCATTHTLPVQVPPQGRYLAPLRVEVDDPANASQVRNGLRASGMFRKITQGPAQPGDYSVLVHYQGSHDKPELLRFFSVMTVKLVPSPETWDSSVAITLSHDGKVLKTYRYHNVTHVYDSVFDPEDVFQNANLDRIGQVFAADVKRDGLVPYASDAR